MEPGTRPKSSTGLALALVLGLLTSACQSATLGEEARQVPAEFAEAPVTPAPRTVNDIISILDQRQHDDAERVFQRLAEAPPSSAGVGAPAAVHLHPGLSPGAHRPHSPRS